MRKQERIQYLKQQELLLEIQQTKLAHQTALSNLENITDPDLIDCYIYELNAAQTRYKFLLNQAKANNVTCSCEVPILVSEN